MATTKNKIKLIRYLSGLGMAVVLISLVGFFVWQVSSLAREQYQIRYLQSAIKELKLENQQLKVQVADLQSINRIQEAVANLEMSLISSIVYLPVATSEVVIKR